MNTTASPTFLARVAEIEARRGERAIESDDGLADLDLLSLPHGGSDAVDVAMQAMPIADAYRQWSGKSPIRESKRDEISVRCPFREHEDRKASASLSASKNVGNCQVCGGFDAFAIAGEHFRLDPATEFPELKRAIASDLGLDITAGSARVTDRRADENTLEKADAPKRAERRTRWTADELMAEVFPPLLWAVAGIIAAGLSLLVGAPKVGKSWLALNLAIAIAAGGKALGRIDVEGGDVLYLALEDTKRRVQRRMGTILAGASASPRLTIELECEPIRAGGGDLIRAWCEAHPERRFIAVDVFARVRGKSDVRANRYDDDYAATAELKDIADEYGVPILLVHHTRKAESSDFLEQSSGTNGITGAADAILVLARARKTTEAILSVTGRDIEEAEYALKFDPRICTWQLDGETLDRAATRVEVARAIENLGDRSADVLAYVNEHPDGVAPKGVNAGLGMEDAGVYLKRLYDTDRIAKARRGLYVPVSSLSQVSSSSVGNNTHDRNNGPLDDTAAVVADVSVAESVGA